MTSEYSLKHNDYLIDFLSLLLAPAVIAATGVLKNVAHKTDKLLEIQ